MSLFHDRYLRALLIVTVLVIAVMFLAHERTLRDTSARSVRDTDRPHSDAQTNDPSAARSPRVSVRHAGPPPSLPSPGPFRVSRVIDGDTLVLDNGETVRLIGVDAPEIHHPEIPVQRFGQEAAAFLRRMAEGFECRLDYEPEDLRDRYGRLLAYVFVQDRLVNAEMIRRGYAYAYTVFPYRKKEQFLAIEKEARWNQRGLWNLSLKDGRVANLVSRYDTLNMEGRRKLDEIMDGLVRDYPAEPDRPAKTDTAPRSP